MSSPPFNSKPYRWRQWIFLCAVAVQLLVATVSIHLQSAARIAVSGESLWTKGLYAAVMQLQRYAEAGAPQEYMDFAHAIAIPQGISAIRQTLDSGSTDVDPLIRRMPEQASLEDLELILHVLPWVWDTQPLTRYRELWRLGDIQAEALDSLGAEIFERRSSGQPVSKQDIDSWLQRIADIRSAVIPLAQEFRDMLGERSRRLSDLLLIINTLTAIVLGTLYWISVQRAVRESSRAYNRLEAERQRSNITLAALGDGVITLDELQRIRYANPAAARLLDRPVQQLLGRHIGEVLPFAPAVIAQQESLAPDAPAAEDSHVHWIEREAQSKVAVRVSVSPLREDEEATGGIVLVLHDVSQEQTYMRMLVWQQSHDLLTGLNNRATFEKHLQQALGKDYASLLHLNLDHFKMVNASYGHAAGDEILRQVCQQLRMVLRDTDVLARVGGDEFAVLLTPSTPHAATQTAERLRKAVHDLHVQWRQHNLQMGVSIGVVHIDPEYPIKEPQVLLSMADRACKHAKESGRNRISVFNPLNSDFQRYQGDMEWMQRLRASLENDQFTLMAQTVYPLKQPGKGMGGAHFEVLLRLQDGPDRLIAPAEFIGIAERYDLMPLIDRWVIRNALRQLRQCLSAGANISTCSINLSAAGLGDSELLDFIRNCIFEYGVAAEKLCFEVTETSAIASLDSATNMMEELRRLGCRFSLDDFGSGMASFKYLQCLPVDYLKIDGSFVQDMLQNPHNHAMVDSINHIGHVMGKQTIAEFVGDAATLEALRTMGVDYAQGYHITPPVPFDTAFFQRLPHNAPA